MSATLVASAKILKEIYKPVALSGLWASYRLQGSIVVMHALDEITYEKHCTLIGRIRAKYRKLGDTKAMVTWCELLKKDNGLRDCTWIDLIRKRGVQWLAGGEG